MMEMDGWTLPIDLRTWFVPWLNSMVGNPAVVLYLSENRQLCCYVRVLRPCGRLWYVVRYLPAFQSRWVWLN